MRLQKLSKCPGWIGRVLLRLSGLGAWNVHRCHRQLQHYLRHDLLRCSYLWGWWWLHWLLEVVVLQGVFFVCEDLDFGCAGTV